MPLMSARIGTYMDSPVAAGAPYAAPFRHIVAKWRRGLSLRTRLALCVALGVAGIIALLSFVQVRLAGRTVEAQLIASAGTTAQAVADGMGSLDEAEVPEWLHDFVEAEPSLRIISIVDVSGDG